MQKRGYIIGAAVATAVVAAGGAVASIPDRSGVITSCRDSQGYVRVIDSMSTTACPNGTTRLQWSRNGGVHTVRMAANGQILAKSDNAWGSSWGTGRYYVGWYDLDLTKCSITVEPVGSTATPLMTNVYTTYSYYTMVEVRAIKPGSWPIQYEHVSTEVNITASCSQLPVAPTPTPTPG